MRSARSVSQKILKYIACVPPLLLLFDLLYALTNAVRKSIRQKRSSTMTQVRTQDADLQLASPLFNKVPPEIRNSIFKLALTAHDDPSRRYRPAAHYYRPGFTCAHKIDMGLLLTCRRVYAETARLPASINEHTSWYFRPPPGINKNEIPLGNSPGAFVRQRDLRTIHIFAQQYWLEGAYGGFASFVRLWNIARPTHLKITIRHSDWWWWEAGEPIALDAKREGRPSAQHYSRPSDPFEPGSWGAKFRDIDGLEVLQLELETLENKKAELDAIVNRAKGWRIPLGDSRVLLLNESKTRRMGWVGVPIDHNFGYRDDIDGFLTENTNEAGTNDNDTEVDEVSMLHQAVLPQHAALLLHFSQASEPSELALSDDEMGDDGAPKDPSTARQRLEADGVVFDDSISVRPHALDVTSTYYVVALTWEAH
ncbi:MAG: hypothetical protein Q9218_004546 [Villophora microphyllina]